MTDNKYRLTGNLPHIELQIGDEAMVEGETFHLRGCLDSCAGGTIGYRPYHEHVSELLQDLVNTFMDYKNEGINPSAQKELKKKVMALVLQQRLVIKHCL